MRARQMLRPLAKSAVWLAGRTTSQRRFNGTSLSVPLRAAAHIPAFVDLSYDPLEWHAIRHAVRAGDSCLDVGANIGVMSVLMSRLTGATGRVIAVEPQPTVFSILVEMLERNGCINTTPLQALLMDRCGGADLHLSSATPLGVGSSAVVHDGAGGRSIRVAALTIDALYEDQPSLDYIKVDAEGAETFIIAGAQQTIARCQPVVQVEVHGQYMQDPRESVTTLFGMMEKHGYASLNLASRTTTTAEEFLIDTHHDVDDPASGEDLRHRGYGQMLFVPRHRADLVSDLPSH